jgi:hypothetical protein
MGDKIDAKKMGRVFTTKVQVRGDIQPCMAVHSVIPALRKLKQNYQKFHVNLGYIGWFYLKKEKRNMSEFMQCTKRQTSK